MASIISKEDREYFESYLNEHPVNESDVIEPEFYDDHRFDFDIEKHFSFLIAECLKNYD